MLRAHLNRMPTQQIAVIAFSAVILGSLAAAAKDNADKNTKSEDDSKAQDEAGETADSGGVFDDDKAGEKADAAPQSETASTQTDDSKAAEKSAGGDVDMDIGEDEVDMDIGEDEVDLNVEETSDDKGEAEKGILATTFENDTVARRDRGINILTAHATRKGALTLVVDHRPYKNLFSKADAFYDYLGLDRGESLKVGFGLRYGILDGLDFGIYRLNDGGLVDYDTYEFDLRYAFLNQTKYFVNVMARAGASWFSSETQKDALGGFAQIFVDRIFFDTLLVGVGFAFHSESSSEYKERDKNLGKDIDSISAAVTGVIEWRALDFMAVTAEIAAAVVGYKQDYPVGALALKFLTHRHTFSIMLTTSQFINADGIVANTWRTPKELIFGFQIFREFDLVDY